MLTNNDIAIIDSLLQKRISENNSQLEKWFEKRMRDGFTEFFEMVLEPYLEHERNDNKKEHEMTREQIESLNEHIKDHERRIRKLEVKTGL